MAFNVDRLNPHAVRRAAEALGYAACPVAPEGERWLARHDKTGTDD